MTNKSLVSSRVLLDNARRTGCAVAALNFYNAETLRAHINAANALQVPVILQTTAATINYLGLGLAVALAQAAAREIVQPVALHLDHGASYELAAQCIAAGYTSVMFDGSRLPWAENVAVTRRVTEMAHAAGVAVEAELGHVAHNDDGAEITDFFTAPDAAAQFVAETGVDALAIAIGTAHGFYKGAVRLDFERLQQIRAAVGPETALVLHGGSGVPEELLRRAIAAGITKINFGTELKDAFTRAVKASLVNSADIDLRRTFAPAIAAVQEVAAAKMRVCARH